MTTIFCPARMKHENITRRALVATFDNVVLSLHIQPGQDQLDAVVSGWKDPVRVHDNTVMSVEKLMEVAEEKQRDFVKKQREFKNWESGWLLMNERPDDLEEYLKLKPAMADFHERIELVKKPEDRIELEQQWKRFKRLAGGCEKLIEARSTLETMKGVKDLAFETYRAAAKELEHAQEHEREVSEQISEDHVEADMRAKGAAELFPAVQIGHIITKVNSRATEGLPFDEIIAIIDEASPPHTLEFRRYDFKQNQVNGRWDSLDELRSKGKYVDDPRIPQNHFVEAAAKGKTAILEQSLQSGEDVNAQDFSRATGMHYAAANGREKVMDLLISNGAHIDARDENSATPLLHAARTGNHGSVVYLLDKGADIDAVDSQGRTAVFYAIISESIDLVQTLLEKRTSLTVMDKAWGWTPLHYAASTGSNEIVELLLHRKASPYATSKQGQTPLDVAQKNRCMQVRDTLQAFIFAEPAQKVLTHPNGSVWVGCKDAASPKWAKDRAFTAILSVGQASAGGRHLEWVKDEPSIKHACFCCKDTGNVWLEILRQIRPMLHFIKARVEEECTLLVHCDAGTEIAQTIVVCYMMTYCNEQLPAAIGRVRAARTSTAFGDDAADGLDEFSRLLAKRKLNRLNNRLRNSEILAL